MLFRDFQNIDDPLTFHLVLSRDIHGPQMRTFMLQDLSFMIFWLDTNQLHLYLIYEIYSKYLVQTFMVPRGSSIFLCLTEMLIFWWDELIFHVIALSGGSSTQTTQEERCSWDDTDSNPSDLIFISLSLFITPMCQCMQNKWTFMVPRSGIKFNQSSTQRTNTDLQQSTLCIRSRWKHEAVSGVLLNLGVCLLLSRNQRNGYSKKSIEMF